MRLIQVLAASLRPVAEATPWNPGMSAARYTREAGPLRVRFVYHAFLGQYILGVERRDRPPDETDVHAARIAVGGPLLWSRWERYEHEGWCGVRLRWKADVADLQSPAEALAWLDRNYPDSSEQKEMAA